MFINKICIYASETFKTIFPLLKKVFCHLFHTRNFNPSFIKISKGPRYHSLLKFIFSSTALAREQILLETLTANFQHQTLNYWENFTSSKHLHPLFRFFPYLYCLHMLLIGVFIKAVFFANSQVGRCFQNINQL